jgi:hypothetical protein
MGKQNDQNPDEFFVPLVGFLHGTLNQHPNPKDGAEDGQWVEKQYE